MKKFSQILNEASEELKSGSMPVDIRNRSAIIRTKYGKVAVKKTGSGSNSLYSVDYTMMFEQSDEKVKKATINFWMELFNTVVYACFQLSESLKDDRFYVYLPVPTPYLTYTIMSTKIKVLFARWKSALEAEGHLSGLKYNRPGTSIRGGEFIFKVNKAESEDDIKSREESLLSEILDQKLAEISSTIEEFEADDSVNAAASAAAYQKIYDHLMKLK